LKELDFTKAAVEGTFETNLVPGKPIEFFFVIDEGITATG
jgi:hypothetical protein